MSGLSTREAAKRLSEFGPNALPEPAPEALWRRFLRQFASPLVGLTYGVMRKRFMVAWDTGAIAVVYAVAIRFLVVFGR